MIKDPEPLKRCSRWEVYLVDFVSGGGGGGGSGLGWRRVVLGGN